MKGSVGAVLKQSLDAQKIKELMPISRKANAKLGKIFEMAKNTSLKDVKRSETHFLFINDRSQSQPNRNRVTCITTCERTLKA